MPPRKKTVAGPPPLTDEEVSGLRAQVSAGDKPRVVVRAASAAVPAGTRGNVIRIGNPSDGEFIVVRLGRDEVPFAPSELGLSARGKAAAAAAAPVSKRAPAPARRPAPRKAAAAKSATATAKASAAKTSAAKTGATKTGPAKAAPAKTPPAAAAATSTPARAGRTTAARRRGKKIRTGPPLTVTLRFANDTWTVEAQRGARRLAKASPLRPGAVKAFADLVDEPNVRDALSQTVASSRAVVEERAQKLRAELHAAETALKEYEARRR